MFTLTVVIFALITMLGAVLYIECNIVQELPEANKFKKWWRKNVVRYSL